MKIIDVRFAVGDNVVADGFVRELAVQMRRFAAVYGLVEVSGGSPGDEAQIIALSNDASSGAEIALLLAGANATVEYEETVPEIGGAFGVGPNGRVTG